MSIARTSADIVGHTAQRPSIFTSSSSPRLNAIRVSTSISSSRAASTARAQRGSRSNFQHDDRARDHERAVGERVEQRAEAAVLAR